jgi:hypothetical protein
LKQEVRKELEVNTLYKHVLWFFTIAERNAAQTWIKANFAVFTEDFFVLSKIYNFYTSFSLDEVQINQIANIAGLEEHFLNEEM